MQSELKAQFIVSYVNLKKKVKESIYRNCLQIKIPHSPIIIYIGGIINNEMSWSETVDSLKKRRDIILNC